MRRIPLFPLPLVLYPGAVQPLHIFEPRYRRMVARCLEFDRQFGLIFHDPDVAGPFMSEPGRVGCVAEIERMQLLEDGRSLILTRGRDRFLIHDGVESNTPYYEGLVDAYDDLAVEARALREKREESLALFRRVLRSLPQPPDPIPEFDPSEEVAFRLASTIDTAPSWHQEILELRDERERLLRVDRIFRVALEAAE